MSADTGNENISSEIISRNSSWKNKCKALISQYETKSSGSANDETIVDMQKKQEHIEAALRLAELKITETERLIEETSSNSEINSSVRYILKLYESISKLTWDLDCPSTQVKGFVINKKLRTFNLDTTLYSEYFIVNHLWSLIGSGDL